MGTPHIYGMLARLNPHLTNQDTEAQQVILNQILGLHLLCYWAPAITLCLWPGDPLAQLPAPPRLSSLSGHLITMAKFDSIPLCATCVA